MGLLLQIKRKIVDDPYKFKLQTPFMTFESSNVHIGRKTFRQGALLLLL